MCENNDIRREARANGVPFWRIAKALSISEPTMTRRMRQKLSEEEKAKILKIIEELREE